MRWSTLLFLLGFGSYASAQCCCSDIRLSITVSDGKESDYVMVRDAYEVRSRDMDSTDQVLSIDLDAGCGVAEREVTITRNSTKQVMELHVLFIGFDGVHPGLRVPFQPGKYEVDFTRLRESAGASRREDLAPSDTATSRIVQCGTCTVRLERDSKGVTMEPLDLREGGCGPGRVEVGGIGQAYCPDGQGAFQASVQELIDRKVGLRAKGSVMYTGIASINDRGNFYGRIAHEQTDRVYNIEIGLMKGPLWTPAWVVDADAPGGKRMVSSMVRFKLVSGAGRDD